MDEKDFEENVSDIKIEQRYHERHFNELYNSGYRDGYQANMENEKYLQDGFNIGYNISAKISFLIGTIYACFEKYKFTTSEGNSPISPILFPFWKTMLGPVLHTENILG